MKPIEQQIIDLIKQEEENHYEQLTDMTKHFGSDDKGTRYSAAKWNAIVDILDKVEDLVKVYKENYETK